MTETLDLVLWGATGQAKVLNELVATLPYRVVALVDNRQIPSPLPGVAMLHGLAGLEVWLTERPSGRPLAGAVAIGSASGGARTEIMDMMAARGIRIVTLVHPRAYIAVDAVLGEGCQILANATVCTHARLGRGVIVNTAASVDHDCVLGDGVHIGPGARLSGEITVGARTFVGIGATIIPRITIGEGAVIGGGAVVIRDVPDGSLVVGNPARPIPRKDKNY